MQNHFIKLIVCFFIFLQSSYACTVYDDTGKKIQLTKSATKIISLAPDLTEILFAAGAGKFIVGVMQGSDFPDAAKTLPIIASYNHINIETILALHPDLVVAWTDGVSLQQLKMLEQFHIPIYLSKQTKVTDVPSTLERLGCLAGTKKIATLAANNFRKRYESLRQKYSTKKPLRIFYQVWSDPLITINQQSWINQVINLCGGENVFSKLSTTAPVINFEAVVLANPDVIISSSSLDRWRDWPQMTAVKKGNLFKINPDLIERSGPRILEGAEVICHEIEIARSRS